MKLNRKSLLKATIAMTGLFLAGCVSSQSGSGDVACDYCSEFEDVIIVDEMEQNDVATFFEEEPCAEEETVSVAKKQTVLSSSHPAEPDFIPVKPKSACRNGCGKKKAATKQKPVAPVVELPTPAVETVEYTSEVEEVNVLSAEEEARIRAEQELQERLERERMEQERLEAERHLAEQMEAERLKAETERLRAEAERLRLEKEALEQEALRKEALESEKIEDLQIQDEQASKDVVVVTDAQKVVKDESCEDVKDWVASEGSTLRTLLLEWGDKVGWRIVWNMDRDYTLEASAVFRGRFVDVAAALLRSFARATPAPKGIFYKGNKVLVVSTREDENAD